LKRKKYDKTFKVAAVRQVLVESKKVSHVARALGTLPTMLSRTPFARYTMNLKVAMEARGSRWNSVSEAFSRVRTV
jgi:transposase